MEETDVQRERELRSQLARQSAAHNDHVKEVLRVQQHELQTAFDVRLAGLVDKERAALQQKVAAWTGRMHGIDKALAGSVSIVDCFLCIQTTVIRISVVNQGCPQDVKSQDRDSQPSRPRRSKKRLETAVSQFKNTNW